MASTNQEKLDKLKADSREARIENNLTQIQLLKVNPK